jgi:hypothetical protein
MVCWSSLVSTPNGHAENRPTDTDLGLQIICLLRLSGHVWYEKGKCFAYSLINYNGIHEGTTDLPWWK